MSQTSPTTSGPVPVPVPDLINRAAAKLCHIVKRPDFDGYGFNLHSEKAKPGQFIGKVDANSPAEAAGLKEGDRIIEVNGVPINNESHKQVVQRIKTISKEVRLLLIDVDGKGDGHLMHNGYKSNAKGVEMSKTEQVLPGASENINSITMVSTKRASQETQRSSTTAIESKANNNGMDVTDRGVVHRQQDHHQVETMINNNNTPPPPSATMALPKKAMMMNHNNNISSVSGSSPTSNASSTNGSHLGEPVTSGSGSAATRNNTIKAGSLQLPMTAAEMRAKLMMKKKYDPKNESVDLKKKYDIVQKL